MIVVLKLVQLSQADGVPLHVLRIHNDVIHTLSVDVWQHVFQSGQATPGELDIVVLQLKVAQPEWDDSDSVGGRVPQLVEGGAQGGVRYVGRHLAKYRKVDVRQGVKRDVVARKVKCVLLKSHGAQPVPCSFDRRKPTVALKLSEDGGGSLCVGITNPLQLFFCARERCSQVKAFIEKGGRHIRKAEVRHPQRKKFTRTFGSQFVDEREQPHAVVLHGNGPEAQSVKNVAGQEGQEQEVVDHLNIQ
mmetsp:Transcript_44952/g.113265  ORF Transcript_44952/g.113265 Transcript_44952/m.113265 type:complete len:246 (+) Transcript_44952:631-1368(+)